MNRNTIKKMQNEISEVLAKYGAVSKNNARWDDTLARFTTEVVFESNKSPEDLEWFDGNTEMVKMGFARPGTKVLYFDGKECKIIKPRRTKYLFEFLTGPQAGQQFVASFRNFKSGSKVEA